MNQFGLVESVDGLREGVVIAVAAHRGLYACLRQPLAVSNGHVLRPAVAMVDQGVLTFGLPGVQRLFERVEDEVGMHRTAHPPAHDAPGKHVHHEGYVEPALPSRDVREVRDSELTGTLGGDLPINLLQSVALTRAPLLPAKRQQTLRQQAARYCDK